MDTSLLGRKRRPCSGKAEIYNILQVVQQLFLSSAGGGGGSVGRLIKFPRRLELTWSVFIAPRPPSCPFTRPLLQGPQPSDQPAACWLELWARFGEGRGDLPSGAGDRSAETDAAGLHGRQDPASEAQANAARGELMLMAAEEGGVGSEFVPTPRTPKKCDLNFAVQVNLMTEERPNKWKEEVTATKHSSSELFFFFFF